MIRRIESRALIGSLVVAAAVVAAPGAALAQQPASSFADLGASVSVGRTLFATGAAGAGHRPNVFGLSAQDQITAARRPPETVSRGEWIGLAVGLAVGVAVAVAARASDPAAGCGAAAVTTMPGKTVVPFGRDARAPIRLRPARRIPR
jgi:hypothetical protein